MRHWWVIGEDRYTAARVVSMYVEADTRLKAINVARRKAGITGTGTIQWTVLKRSDPIRRKP